MLWMALCFPAFALQVRARALPVEAPLAVSDGPANRPRVLAVNRAARVRGVHPGMPLPAAQALAGELRILPRDAAAETAALANLAAWAGQFSAHVSLEPQRGLLLEVGGSLRLFEGLAPLLGRIEAGLHDLGYRVQSAVAPAPLAAWVLARAGEREPCLEFTSIRARVGDLPVELLDWPEETLSALHALGVRRLGECLALPRDGFARRFGGPRVHDLDRLLGEAADPRPPFAPPERFAARLELGAEAEAVEQILFPLKRLLGELEGFLRGRGAGVQLPRIVYEHRRCAPTSVSIGLLAPERSAERLLGLARERLQRVALPAPVTAVRLEADALLPFAATSASLLPERHLAGEPWRVLVERLAARLGEGALARTTPADDHRPERAWQATRAVAVAGAGSGNAAPADAAALSGRGPRPLYLLAHPRALAQRERRPEYGGVLTLLAGPERIEAGWWDEAALGRDYYIARNPGGETLWVFREHRLPRTWFLHGVFA